MLDTENGISIFSNLNILSGSIDRTGESPDGEIHEVAWVLYHENYSPAEFWKNDIVILRVKKKINYSIFK